MLPADPEEAITMIMEAAQQMGILPFMIAAIIIASAIWVWRRVTGSGE